MNSQLRINASSSQQGQQNNLRLIVPANTKNSKRGRISLIIDILLIYIVLFLVNRFLDNFEHNKNSFRKKTTKDFAKSGLCVNVISFDLCVRIVVVSLGQLLDDGITMTLLGKAEDEEAFFVHQVSIVVVEQWHLCDAYYFQKYCEFNKADSLQSSSGGHKLYKAFLDVVDQFHITVGRMFNFPCREFTLYALDKEPCTFFNQEGYDRPDGFFGMVGM